MVDIFALSVPHAVLLIALWRVMRRADLDREGGEPERQHPARRGTPRG